MRTIYLLQLLVSALMIMLNIACAKHTTSSILDNGNLESNVGESFNSILTQTLPTKCHSATIIHQPLTQNNEQNITISEIKLFTDTNLSELYQFLNIKSVDYLQKDNINQPTIHEVENYKIFTNLMDLLTDLSPNSYTGYIVFKSSLKTQEIFTKSINFEDWKKECGDAVVTQEDLGAYLINIAEIKFLGSLDKNNFEQKFNKQKNALAALSKILDEIFAVSTPRPRLKIYQYIKGFNITDEKDGLPIFYKTLKIDDKTNIEKVPDFNTIYEWAKSFKQDVKNSLGKTITISPQVIASKYEMRPNVAEDAKHTINKIKEQIDELYQIAQKLDILEHNMHSIIAKPHHFGDKPNYLTINIDIKTYAQKKISQILKIKTSLKEVVQCYIKSAQTYENIETCNLKKQNFLNQIDNTEQDVIGHVFENQATWRLYLTTGEFE